VSLWEEEEEEAAAEAPKRGKDQRLLGASWALRTERSGAGRSRGRATAYLDPASLMWMRRTMRPDQVRRMISPSEVPQAMPRESAAAQEMKRDGIFSSCRYWMLTLRSSRFPDLWGGACTWLTLLTEKYWSTPALVSTANSVDDGLHRIVLYPSGV
jgi:hypothetical protein